MGRVINLELNLQSLLTFAENALNEGDTLSCALNLNEAMNYATSREEKRAVYAVFIKCFNLTNNVRSVMDVIAKDVAESADEDYFRLDLGLKRRAYFDEEEEPPDYAQVTAFGKIRNLICERRYDVAMELLSKTAINYECMEEVVEALLRAVECDQKLNLDKYMMPLIGIMASSPNRVDMLRLLLEGGKHTHALMVDSADFLLDEEDSNVLCMMGMAFYENNELETAEKFFLKALEDDPIDEDALYYMSAIGKQLDIKEHEKYWDRYKQVYGITDAPTGIIEEFWESEDNEFLVPYLSLPTVFARRKAKELSKKAKSGEWDKAFEREFSEYACVAPEHMTYKVINDIGKLHNKPEAKALYKKLLMASRVPCSIKERMLEALIEYGYEGDICLLLDKKIIFARLTKLHRRVQKNWQMIYNVVLRNLLFIEPYVPIRCSTLSAVIKKLDTMIVLDEEDFHFAYAIAIVNYINKLHINIELLDVLRALSIDGAAVDKGISKYGIDGIVV